MTISTQQKPNMPLEPLAIINQLLIAAIEAQNQNALKFVFTNETKNLIRYNRAILFTVDKKNISIASISGQSSLNTFTELYRKLSELVKYLEQPSIPQVLSAEKFTNKKEIWAEYQRENASSIMWLPIFCKGELILGLWIEQWEASTQTKFSDDILALMTKYLLPGYGSAWGKFQKKFQVKPASKYKYKVFLPLFVFLLSLLFLIRIPLRIVAPCEVVPKDPYIVTAPLQGVIDKIAVKPGQHVDVGVTLFKYDPRIFEQELKIAQNEFLVNQAAFNRALALGVNEQPFLSEVGILELKLHKQEIDLQLAKDNYKKVDVKAPEAGVAIIDNLDQWPGKPVQIGEKIMTIADLSKTKVRIWIPENDNIRFNRDLPVKVILNAKPELQLEARVDYIASKVVMSEQQIPSFIAEANWEEQTENVTPGLKGTAVLYGEKVSLFYYLIRKPWILVRRIIS